MVVSGGECSFQTEGYLAMNEELCGLKSHNSSHGPHTLGFPSENIRCLDLRP